MSEFRLSLKGKACVKTKDNMRYIIDDRKYHFKAAFDTESGAYVRTGILDENGKDGASAAWVGNR